MGATSTGLFLCKGLPVFTARPAPLILTTHMTRTFSADCDVFAKVVVQADARGEFLNAGQIDALAAMVAESNKRMDAVNRITSNASKIVTSAARDLFDQQPALIAPGGNAYTHRRMGLPARHGDSSPLHHLRRLHR